MSLIIFDSEEQRIAIEYFSRLSDTVGAVGIGVCFTLLQFKDPSIAAAISSVVFFIWAISLGTEFRKMVKRAPKASKPSIWLFIRYGWFGYISLMFMSFIALGVIPVEWFQ
ncbi:hypothetical protein HWV00_01825 [Moritella sp. 24]|uniref:hypothetical protein n=1 Tax=Moritella sp. 24 TaxID=2746230 RepID=UPI001BA89604|nr:hypothetical protein [Moritella sp. 24]QUM75079.1 hypothetical protein HWV00_01825 [Moritella sp. 24]